jgi:hypothetical protein
MMLGIERIARAGRSWLRRLVYGRALKRAIMDERGWQEAADRYPELYELELVQSRAEVKRLSLLNGVEQ